MDLGVSKKDFIDRYFEKQWFIQRQAFRDHV